MVDYVPRPKPWSDIQVTASTTPEQIVAVFGTGAEVISFDISDLNTWQLLMRYGGNQASFAGSYGQYLRAQRTSTGEQCPWNALVMDVSLAADPGFQAV